MIIRDRIKCLRRVRAELLKPHPRNWRTHPAAQREALRGVLSEIGYADALVARELADGSLELIDGHLRAEVTPDAEVPVVVVDLDDAEAEKLLAVLDPLAALAGRDNDVLAALLQNVESENTALSEFLDSLLREPSPLDDADSLGEKSPRKESQAGPPPEVEIGEAFQVVVDCIDENQQREVYERLTAEGFNCRLLNL